MRIAVITISESGAPLARTLAQELQAQSVARTDVGPQWHHYDAFIFIGAMGICVRTIAPFIEDKHTTLLWCASTRWAVTPSLCSAVMWAVPTTWLSV